MYEREATTVGLPAMRDLSLTTYEGNTCRARRQDEVKRLRRVWPPRSRTQEGRRSSVRVSAWSVAARMQGGGMSTRSCAKARNERWSASASVQGNERERGPSLSHGVFVGGVRGPTWLTSPRVDRWTLFLGLSGEGEGTRG